MQYLDEKINEFILENSPQKIALNLAKQSTKFNINDILLNVSRVNNQLYISSIEYKKEILDADSVYDSEGVDFQAEIIWR
jgi:hypothetical protein